MYLLWIGIGGRPVEVTITSPAWRQGKIINAGQKKYHRLGSIYL